MIMFGTSGNSNSNSSKYKKRERTQNWCIDEKKYLLELCRKDMYIIENKRLDSALTSLKNRAWKIIYRKFCHTFGTDRNCNRIKEQWRRMKACARAEILDYQHRISKFGQDVADKKKPSAFTFEIWDFMQEAKKLCKNELTDEVDYSKIKLSLEENMSAEDLAMDDEDIAGSESSHSSNWANNSHNMCEVQMKEDSESRAMPNDLNGFFPQDNSDLLNYLKGQYLAHQQNEHLYRTNFSHKDNNLLQEQPMDLNSGDERLREHAMRMEILKVELETAKIKKEIAELNKEMLLKQLNEMK
ncbi:uncharacterized protein LOC134828115 [Culicoides brevitarsis]|uniref:uncharacterized protein LOC134828115 n=1 Tax=Culicoides brevitarsis TaxID=469753 RepID=UPI00307C5C07